MSIELSEMSALIKALTEAARPPAAFPRTTEPPTYDGVRDAMVIDSWIRSVNRYAKFHEWVDERKLSYAITLLRGRAEAWYRSLEIGEEIPENWETFEEGLVGFFKPENCEFRSKYIVDTVGKVNFALKTKEDFESNPEKYDEKPESLDYDLFFFLSLNDDECHVALQKFMGVGAKVADCIMLFSMKKKSAFPVDVWIKRAMIHFYVAPDVTLPKMRIFARDKFGKYSGMAQQYLFYYARENKIEV